MRSMISSPRLQETATNLQPVCPKPHPGAIPSRLQFRCQGFELHQEPRSQITNATHLWLPAPPMFCIGLLALLYEACLALLSETVLAVYKACGGVISARHPLVKCALFVLKGLASFLQAL